MPDAAIPTTETGTRHRTAERVARSLGVDPETALLARARSYRDEIDRHG